MEQLTDDAERLLDELDARGFGKSIAWVGLSMGGMVGQELALRAPRRVKALVIANSTSRYPAEGRGLWTQRLEAIDAGGLEAIADGAMQRWFSEAFRREQPAAVARWRRRVVATSQEGYVGAMHAVMNIDTTDRLASLAVPTLVVAGSEDQGTPPAMSQVMAQRIPRAQLVVLEGAAHLSVIEQPRAFEHALRSFLARR
jgi:3-oxoadipate enol-lactonase